MARIDAKTLAQTRTGRVNAKASMWPSIKTALAPTIRPGPGWKVNLFPQEYSIIGVTQVCHTSERCVAMQKGQP